MPKAKVSVKLLHYFPNVQRLNFNLPTYDRWADILLDLVDVTVFMFDTDTSMAEEIGQITLFVQ